MGDNAVDYSMVTRSRYFRHARTVSTIIVSKVQSDSGCLDYSIKQQTIEGKTHWEDKRGKIDSLAIGFLSWTISKQFDQLTRMRTVGLQFSSRLKAKCCGNHVICVNNYVREIFTCSRSVPQTRISSDTAMIFHLILEYTKAVCIFKPRANMFF